MFSTQIPTYRTFNTCNSQIVLLCKTVCKLEAETRPPYDGCFSGETCHQQETRHTFITLLRIHIDSRSRGHCASMLNPALESGETDATENNNALLIAARQMNAETEENYSIDTLLLALQKK